MAPIGRRLPCARCRIPPAEGEHCPGSGKTGRTRGAPDAPWNGTQGELLNERQAKRQGRAGGTLKQRLGKGAEGLRVMEGFSLPVSSQCVPGGQSCDAPSGDRGELLMSPGLILSTCNNQRVGPSGCFQIRW